MSIIKNDKIWLYGHFNKIIKRPETSFQSPSVNQNTAYNTLVFDQVSF